MKLREAVGSIVIEIGRSLTITIIKIKNHSPVVVHKDHDDTDTAVVLKIVVGGVRYRAQSPGQPM